MNQPSRLDVARALLLRGSVFAHINPRHEAGLLIPTNLRKLETVILEFGYAMPIHIPDLRVDEDGVYATLSFRGPPFTCFVPWTSVYALVTGDGKGVVWEETMPDSVRNQTIAARALPGTKPVTTAATGVLVHLDALRAGLEAARGFTPHQFTKRGDGAAARPSYLRVVK